jgi:hypothetical protein
MPSLLFAGRYIRRLQEVPDCFGNPVMQMVLCPTAEHLEATSMLIKLADVYFKYMGLYAIYTTYSCMYVF